MRKLWQSFRKDVYMAFLTALGLLVGLFSGGLSIYEFAKSRQRPGAVLAIIAIGLLVGAFLLGNISSLFGNGRTYVNFTPTTNGQQTQTGSSLTPTPQTSTSIPSSTQAQQTPTPTPSPTPSTYEADSTWSGWNGTADWKVSGGLLLNDGTYADYNAGATIVAPFQSQTADYAVAIQMQVVRPFTTGTIYPCFYITFRGMGLSNGWQGYAAAVCANLGHGPAVQIVAIDSTNNVFDVLSTTPFDPQNAWHSYRVEVKGTTIKFLVDGGLLLSADDSRFLGGGQIGLLSEYMQVKLSSFKITAL